MKKLIAIALSAVLAVSLVGCAAPAPATSTAPAADETKTEAPAADATAPATDASAKKDITVGFSQIGAESDWRVACTNSIKSAFEEAGIPLSFSDAQQKQENQLKALRSFITQGVDVIAFSPVVESGWDEVMEEIKDANIPVILVDRQIDNKDESLYTTFIGSDFKLEGQRAGIWLKDYLKEKGRDGEEINIVELQGTVGSAPANDRKIGFEEAIKDAPNLKITKSQTGDFTRALGKEVMESFLKSGEKIDVLYSHNDDMALGAIQAIKDAGKKPGEDIIIIGVDSVKGAFEAIVAGEMNCTVECNPLLGPQIVELVEKITTGQPVEKWTVSEEGVFDITNAAEALPNRKY